MPKLTFIVPKVSFVSIRLLFFFHAQHGMRDFHVTGVQTCALPISTIASIRRARYLAGRGALDVPDALRGRHRLFRPSGVAARPPLGVGHGEDDQAAEPEPEIQ